MGRSKQGEIERAAIHLFEEKGFHATSMQDIAEAVGLQKGSLYHYISGKDELLAAIAQQTLAGYVQRLADIVELPQPASERLAMAIRAHLEATAADREMMTVLLRESYAITSEQRAHVAHNSARYRDLFTQIIRDGMASGEFATADPEVAALVLIGSCNWFHRWYDPAGRLDLNRIADVFVALSLRGLEVPSAP